MSVLLRLCLSLVLLAPALVHAATLENPGNGSFYSGIGVVSGWKCTANGPLTVRFNGGSPIHLAYWNERPDVRDAGVCPSAHVGFVAIMNWANLSDGTHTAVVYDNGVEFARSTFEVATTGESFVTGAEGECRVEDFPAPGESAQFSWNQSTQHLEMVGEDGNGGDGGRGVDDHGNTAQEATPVAVTSSTPGSLEPASDEDWFRLQVSSTGFLRLYPAGGGTWVELYRGEEVGKIVSWSEDRNAEVRLHDNGRDNQGNYFAHYRVVPDVYYAVVRGGATGPYQFDTRWTSSFQRGEDRHDPPAREGNGDTGESSGGSGGPGTLENPGNGSFYSGIGVISGWKCTANGPLTVRFNGGDAIPLAYGNERSDVRDAGACPSAQVGFVSIMNWANLGDGTHTAVVYDNGVEFGRSTFEVATTGESFVTGAEGECRVEDFPAPGESMRFVWNEATQHLEMVGGSGGSGSGGGAGELGPPWSEATVVRLGSDIRGALAQADDVNYYRLDIPDAGTVTVDTTGNTDTIGQLRTGPTGTGPDGSLVGEDDGAGGGNNFRISQPLPAGTYYLLVSGRMPGDYTLRVRFTPAPACASDDHGNTPDSATMIGFDTTVRGRLECESDEDYFRVSVPRDGILDVKIWDTSRRLNADIFRVDARGRREHWTAIPIVPPAQLPLHTTTRVPAGIYYIRTKRQPIAAELGYRGDYKMKVRLYPTEDDHGDGARTGDPTQITPPVEISGIIQTLSGGCGIAGLPDVGCTETDAFRIELPAYRHVQNQPVRTYRIEIQSEPYLHVTAEYTTGGADPDVREQHRGIDDHQYVIEVAPNFLEFRDGQPYVKQTAILLRISGSNNPHNTGVYNMRIVRLRDGESGGDGGDSYKISCYQEGLVCFEYIFSSQSLHDDTASVCREAGMIILPAHESCPPGPACRVEISPDGVLTTYHYVLPQTVPDLCSELGGEYIPAGAPDG